jgi:hypothetical protein
MNQSQLTFQESEQKGELQEQENQKPAPRHKPVVLRGRDGRIIGHKKRTREELVSDFWARVKKGGKDECWEWTGGTNGNTPITCYGVLGWGQEKIKAHRFSYELTFGKIPTGLLVCHHCDNPKCVNPNHLFLGTSKDNSDDCHKKGRAHRESGEKRYNAKLTESDIREIRRRHIPGKYGSLSALAREFGVYNTMIHSIVTRKRWKHVL